MDHALEASLRPNAPGKSDYGGQRTTTAPSAETQCGPTPCFGRGRAVFDITQTIRKYKSQRFAPLRHWLICFGRFGPSILPIPARCRLEYDRRMSYRSTGYVGSFGPMCWSMAVPWDGLSPTSRDERLARSEKILFVYWPLGWAIDNECPIIRDTLLWWSTVGAQPRRTFCVPAPRRDLHPNEQILAPLGQFRLSL